MAIIGVVAIAMDGGLLLDHKRQVQSAADAAALAGAEDLYANWAANQGRDTTGTGKTSALATAAANGFTNDGVNSVVTVTFSPGQYQAGPNAGTAIPAGYVEVIVKFNQARGFSSIFGSSSLPVVARAVARGRRKASNIGILVLNPTADSSLAITGSASMKVDGKVIVDSSSFSAASSSGGAGLTSTEMDITGNYSSSNNSFFSANPLKTSQTATPDFLANVPVPDPTTMTVQSKSQLNISSPAILNPGVYVGGISISAQVTLNPGIYYLQGGGFTMGGSSPLTANGVMLYNGPGSDGSTGPISIAGSGTVVISPPTSGPWYGISVFQNRTATSTITLQGSSGTNFTGTIYAASGSVVVSGSNGSTMGSQYVSNTLSMSGSSTFNDINPANGYAPRDIRLVE